jgi:gentisate 1,2-dioxygenase
MFFEPHPAGYEPVARTADISPMRFAWKDTLRRLDECAPDPSGPYGTLIELGEPAMRTIALHMMRLTPGVPTATHRTTANNIYAVAQGSGTSTIDGESFAWSRGDCLGVPAWRPHSHRASGHAVLLRVSDEALLRPLALLRQEGL